MKKILIIGSLNIDMVIEVDHTPVVGETILTRDMEMIPGGKGANQAYAAGKLEADIAILGAVGKDMYADMLMGSLKEGKVDVSHIIRRDQGNTGLAVITVNKDGDNNIIVIAGTNATLSKTDIDNNIDLIKSCDMVIFQLEIPLDTVVYAAKIAKENKKTVILDPAPVPPEFPEELYRYVDLIKPNETELSMLTGMKDIDKNLVAAAEAIRRKGVKDVVVTLGGNGVYFNSEKSGSGTVPANQVNAVDTTAAGDAFTAAMSIMLAEGKDLKTAVEFANEVAAIVVTRKGAQSSIPGLGEVIEYINAKKET